MKPTLRVIDNAHEHPRDLAKRLITEFRSDAQRHGLPTTNLRDNKGAELLDRDGVVRASYPTYATSGVRRSLWSRIFGR